MANRAARKKKIESFFPVIRQPQTKHRAQDPHDDDLAGLTWRRCIQEGSKRLGNGVPGWFRNPKLLIDSAGLLDKGNYPWTP